jgi:pyruvate kinase
MDGESGKVADWEPDQFDELIEELTRIRGEMLAMEDEFADKLEGLSETHRRSARNLLHYLALRRRDLRPLQERLAALGLSSLGRAESHVAVSVDAVLKVLHCLASRPWRPTPGAEREIGFVEGRKLLESRTETLLGPKPSGRAVRIMVTMPSDAADDYELVRELLASGMDCMRINCAHDDADAWSRMIDNLERAKKEVGRDCRVLMDLGGPKLRTGPIETGPQVVVWHPRRDDFGNVVAPARVWLTPAEAAEPAPGPAEARLPVPGDWLARLGAGDTVTFFDARGASRGMTVTEAVGESRWAESPQTSYVLPGMTLHATHAAQDQAPRRGDEARVGDFPPRARHLALREGETLILTRAQEVGRPAVYDERGELASPGRLAVTLPEIFDYVRPGEAIEFDDGKIGGRIRSVGEDEIVAEITRANPSGSKLRADKGINLPDSDLRLPPLTPTDLEDLPFIATHADLVGYSFVHTAEDVYDLEARLNALGGERVGVILKIETKRAFEELPNLLLAAMRSAGAGVMIARGDLAVECGYERLAEVQEEILWVSEAAHAPVVWATQVLESLAKQGQPSRAEITDAAMGERAECVMLNKGPYIVRAVRTLDNILGRMQGHQSKKRHMLRQLRLADEFSPGT